MPKKPTSKVGRSATTGTFVVGRSRFAKISAVEGVELTAHMKERRAEFDRQGLSPEERRRAIIASYRKG
jgi:hypothetical protein